MLNKKSRPVRDGSKLSFRWDYSNQRLRNSMGPPSLWSAM